jgi:hypothetical protein
MMDGISTDHLILWVAALLGDLEGICTQNVKKERGSEQIWLAFSDVTVRLTVVAI